MNTALTLTVEQPAYGGLSIGRYKGKVVFIAGTIPGETVNIAIEDEKKDYYTASVKEIKIPSPDRIAPKCTYFGSCGGCHFQFITHTRQVQLKEAVLRDSLKRLAKVEINLTEPITDNRPWHYRLRGQFKVSKNNIGFYRARTREVVDIDSCPLMAGDINKKLNKLRTFIQKPVTTEIHITGTSDPTVFLKTSPGNHSKQVLIAMAEGLLESGFTGVCIRSADNRVSWYGQPYVTLSLDNLTYTLSPLSFFQSNWGLNQIVTGTIKNTLSSQRLRKILDLYAGAGNFSLPLAEGTEIVAVEENPYAVQDGMRNVEMNKIKNYHFIHSTAEHYHIDSSLDVLFVNPPRPGLTNRVIKNILHAMPESIVYVSCNPSTLARDLKKLLPRYCLQSTGLIDFFPQTYHIESLTFLNRM
ncbi:MAG: class I SAM-dependent RNA methyltransferase [Nitrospiraceae bacterium]|nr:MAG: class I SAM-dependent RNA methyltransferase [Nitrospiraceae bacterium]